MKSPKKTVSRRFDQYALDLGDGMPPLISYDARTAKPYVNGAPPRRHSASARMARDAAIELVLENERRAWHELHDTELITFLAEKGDAAFIAEDFRHWFMARGNAAPHHPNVWGAVWMAAARQQLVVKTGRFLTPQDVHSHARPTNEWMRAI